jgi:hypothetical protein
MKAQAIFDTVVAHLGKQGRPAINTENSCLYRGPDGTKCAVGFLLKDKQYKPEMEGRDVNGLVNNFKVPAFFSKNEELLHRLQRAHDADNHHLVSGKFSKPKLRKALKRIAADHKLDDTIVAEAI